MQQNQPYPLLLCLTNYPNNVYSCKLFFFFLKMQQRWRWYHPDHVHTIYTLQHFYMQFILGVIIIIWLKKMTIIKLGFIFSHLMFYCYLFLK